MTCRRDPRIKALVVRLRAGGSQSAFATTSYVSVPTPGHCLAAVFVGALIVLVAVAVAQRRHGDPASAEQRNGISRANAATGGRAPSNRRELRTPA